MKHVILMNVGNGKAQKLEAEAFSKEDANIYITAETMQEATNLLQLGLDQAQTACDSWKPKEKPVEEEPAPAEDEPQEQYDIFSPAEDPAGDPKEAKGAIALFEMWLDGLLDGTMPDCKRFEKSFARAYEEICIGKEMPPYYLLFMGFVGGMDFADSAGLLAQLDN